MSPKNMVAVLATAVLLWPGTVEAQRNTRRPAGYPFGGWRAVQMARRIHRRSETPQRGPLPQRLAANHAPAGGPSPAAQLEQKNTPFLGPWSQSYGQVWREYDILPYTAQVSSTSRPERAIVEWILRDTGQDTWHGEQVAVLSADRGKLRVFHNPDVQSRVAQTVDRFVQGGPGKLGLNLRIVTVADPGWRRSLFGLLKPMPGSTHGPQAWLLQREDAALLRTELAKRRDHRLIGTPHLLVHNGQSSTTRLTRQQNFVRDLRIATGALPGYDPQYDQLEEGLALEIVPLLTADREYVDADVKAHLDKVEALRNVAIDVPSRFAGRETTHVQVPQVVQRRVEERFRWPTSQVLLISLGMNPSPVPAVNRRSAFPQAAPRREELLLFVEVVTNGAAQASPIARRRLGGALRTAAVAPSLEPSETSDQNAAPAINRSFAPPGAVRTAAQVHSRSSSYRYRPPRTALSPQRYRR